MSLGDTAHEVGRTTAIGIYALGPGILAGVVTAKMMSKGKKANIGAGVLVGFATTLLWARLINPSPAAKPFPTIPGYARSGTGGSAKAVTPFTPVDRTL